MDCPTDVQDVSEPSRYLISPSGSQRFRSGGTRRPTSGGSSSPATKSHVGATTKIDGLWIGVETWNPGDLEPLEHADDRYASFVSVWGGISCCGKLQLNFVTDHTIRNTTPAKWSRISSSRPWRLSHVSPCSNKTALESTAKRSRESPRYPSGGGEMDEVAPTTTQRKFPDGSPPRVPKTSTNGLKRMFQLEASSCSCEPPRQFVHPVQSPDERN